MPSNFVAFGEKPRPSSIQCMKITICLLTPWCFYFAIFFVIVRDVKDKNHLLLDAPRQNVHSNDSLGLPTTRNGFLTILSGSNTVHIAVIFQWKSDVSLGELVVRFSAHPNDLIE